MPVLQKTIAAYKLWHDWLEYLPKLSRYTLGAKIDSLFIEFTEEIYGVIYSNHQGKSDKLNKSSDQLDRLKLLLKIGWEIKMLDNKKYAALSVPLAEIGKMIGGWKKQLKQ